MNVTRCGSAFGPGPGVKGDPPGIESAVSAVGVLDDAWVAAASVGASSNVLGTVGTSVPGENVTPWPSTISSAHWSTRTPRPVSSNMHPIRTSTPWTIDLRKRNYRPPSRARRQLLIRVHDGALEGLEIVPVHVGNESEKPKERLAHAIDALETLARRPEIAWHLGPGRADHRHAAVLRHLEVGSLRGRP